VAHAYAQIADDLANEIANGTWQGGSPLPTIPELQERFGVSRITVRGALDTLAKQGLVYTGYAKGRRGTLVRSLGRTDHYATDALKPSRKRSRSDAFTENAERAGKTASKLSRCASSCHPRTWLGDSGSHRTNLLWCG
jgi:DNA-binding GntR family transcriptional regulator